MDKVVLYQPSYYPPGAPGSPSTPLALLYLADALERVGIDSVLIDAETHPNHLDALVDESKDALAVGISTMSGHQLANAITAAEALKAKRPDTLLIWGGWHPSMVPEQTAQDPLVDLVVRGPGEETLIEILQAKRGDWDGILGVTWRDKSGHVFSTPDRGFGGLREDRRLPWHKIDMDKYGGKRAVGDDHGDNFSATGGSPFMYMASCGCVYGCRFCETNTIYGRKWHALPAEKVLDELEELYKKWGKEVFYFVDPELFINIRRAKAIMQGIIDRKLRILWKGQVRYEHVARMGVEGMKLAYESGCRQVGMGAESGSPEMIEAINKGSDPKDAYEAARVLKEAGIVGQFNLIFGWPFEQPKHVKENLRFAANLKRANSDCLLPLYFYAPLPGTPMTEDAIRYGFEPPQTMREWAEKVYPFSEPVAPWIRHPKWFKDYVYRVIIFYLPLAFPGEITRGTLKHIRSRMRRLPDLLWIWPAHLLAKIRVATEFYGLPFEWRLFNLLKKILPASVAHRSKDFQQVHRPATRQAALG